jgi:hypothetical protein
MRIELHPCFTALLGPMVGGLVAVPMALLVLYPLYYLSLPEARQRVADLPQDLILVLLGEALLAPLLLLVWHWRTRIRYWLVSDDGITLIERGQPRRKMDWSDIDTLQVEGRTVTLLTRPDRRRYTMHFVNESQAAAVRIFTKRNPS